MVQNHMSEITSVQFIENEIVYVSCCTGEKNQPALDLYKKNGFETAGTIWVDKNVP